MYSRHNQHDKLENKPSLVAEKLRQSDQKPWSEGVKASFSSYTEEMMFRHMQQVSSSSHSKVGR